MQKNWKDIFLVVILCILFPVILFTVMPEKIVRSSDIPDINSLNTQITDADIMIPVLQQNGTVKDIPLEEYLVCVLLCEMPTDFELDALKAQAVVARTYTLRRAVTGGKHINAVVCTDPSCCQGYKEIQDFLNSNGTEEAVSRLRSAVKQTDRLVLTYDDKLIEATYFSCSGGKTEDAKAVWGTDIPYLQATLSLGEEIAKYYTDTVTFTTAEFQELINCDLPENTGSWFGRVTYTDGGGVATIQIAGKEYTGTALRSLLSLRSTAFVISVVGDTVTVTTKGFGHRVGMSQYGAEAMAMSGSDFQEILSHYFQGTQLELISREVIDKAGLMKYNIA